MSESHLVLIFVCRNWLLSITIDSYSFSVDWRLSVMEDGPWTGTAPVYNIYIYIYTYICIYIYTYMCVYILIHIYMY
jgi:hypothetical protein